eukprot:CAMPEP_0114532858 /NCGR_PEP_ID=MMETSP0109-20121206/26907_1 /TAXON_ID=29199 /ORGANISM="Chlorarachnion reptans, Strain CCCM449" /LENGTH=1714 /DNA_ID=CAMNT_0001715985 /DNA_START=801 /DNA_END=5946 /DNA_ORIENTATION=+
MRSSDVKSHRPLVGGLAQALNTALERSTEFHRNTYAVLLEMSLGLPPGDIGPSDIVEVFLDGGGSGSDTKRGLLSKRRPEVSKSSPGTPRLRIRHPSLLAVALERSMGINSAVPPAVVIEDLMYLLNDAQNALTVADEPTFWTAIFSATSREDGHGEPDRIDPSDDGNVSDSTSTLKLKAAAQLCKQLICISKLASDRLQEAVALMEIRAGKLQSAAFHAEFHLFFCELCQCILNDGRRVRAAFMNHSQLITNNLLSLVDLLEHIVYTARRPEDPVHKWFGCVRLVSQIFESAKISFKPARQQRGIFRSIFSSESRTGSQNNAMTYVSPRLGNPTRALVRLSLDSLLSVGHSREERSLRNEICSSIVSFVQDKSGKDKGVSTEDALHSMQHRRLSFKESVERIKRIDYRVLLSSFRNPGSNNHDYAIAVLASLSGYGKTLLKRTEDSKEGKDEIEQLLASITFIVDTICPFAMLDAKTISDASILSVIPKLRIDSSTTMALIPLSLDQDMEVVPLLPPSHILTKPPPPPPLPLPGSPAKSSTGNPKSPSPKDRASSNASLHLPDDTSSTAPGLLKTLCLQYVSAKHNHIKVIPSQLQPPPMITVQSTTQDSKYEKARSQSLPNFSADFREDFGGKTEDLSPLASHLSKIFTKMRSRSFAPCKSSIKDIHQNAKPLETRGHKIEIDCFKALKVSKERGSKLLDRERILAESNSANSRRLQIQGKCSPEGPLASPQRTSAPNQSPGSGRKEFLWELDQCEDWWRRRRRLRCFGGISDRPKSPSRKIAGEHYHPKALTQSPIVNFDGALVMPIATLPGRFSLFSTFLHFSPVPTPSSPNVVWHSPMHKETPLSSPSEKPQIDENSSEFKIRAEVDANASTATPLENARRRATRPYVWDLSGLVAAYRRRYRLQHTAVELFFSDGQSSFLHLQSKENQKEFLKRLLNLKLPKLLPLCARPPRSLLEKSGVTERWVARELSNFEYLMHLNTISGRTFNDLNQYPVFPWILKDYNSTKLKSQSRGVKSGPRDPVAIHPQINAPAEPPPPPPSAPRGEKDRRQAAPRYSLLDVLCGPADGHGCGDVFRDLSKPMGALDPTRLKQVLERFQSFVDTDIPPFHYGSHYSNAAIVCFFMLRLEPFASLHKELQSGKFDFPDRLFSSVKQTWDYCNTSPSSFKELLPEFYYLPEFLTNVNEFDFGKKQDKSSVDNVTLPSWADGDPKKFVAVMRLALESEHTSKYLPKWIDLIFGYRQRGRAALEAHNLFHHLTYEGGESLLEHEQKNDQILKDAVKLQIAQFGQTPVQLFTEPHPMRRPLSGNYHRPNSSLPRAENYVRRLRAHALRNWDDEGSDKKHLRKQSKSYARPTVKNLENSGKLLSHAFEFRVLDKQQGRNRVQVVRLVSGKDGCVWCITSDMVVRYIIDQTEGFDEPMLPQLRAVARATLNSLWSISKHSAAISLRGTPTWIAGSHWDTSVGIIPCSLKESASGGWGISTTLKCNVTFRRSHHLKRVTHVVVGADNTTVLTASDDSTAVVWDLGAKSRLTPRHILRGQTCSICAIAIETRVDMCIVATEDANCRAYSPRNGSLLHSFKFSFSPEKVHHAIITANADMIFAVSNGVNWMMTKCNMIGTEWKSVRLSGKVADLAVTSDGMLLVSAGGVSSYAAAVWDTQNMKLIVHTGKLPDVSVEPQAVSLYGGYHGEEFVLVGCSDGVARAYKLDGA